MTNHNTSEHVINSYPIPLYCDNMLLKHLKIRKSMYETYTVKHVIVVSQIAELHLIDINPTSADL